MVHHEAGSLYFVNHFGPRDTGGAETVTRVWNEAFQKEGYRTVWYGPASRHHQNPLPSRTEIRQLQKVNIPGGTRLPHPADLTRFVSDLARENPDRVIFSATTDKILPFLQAIICSGRADKTTVVIHSDPLPSPSTEKPVTASDKIKNPLRPLVRKLRFLAIRHLLQHEGIQTIAVSHATARRVVDLGLVPQTPDVCMPTTPHNNPDCQPQPKELIGRLQLSTVCRLSPEKGLTTRLIPLAIAAKQRNMPIDVSIVGPECDPEYFQRLREESRGVVSLPGPKIGPELCRTYNQTQVFALLSDHEASGLVLQEAIRHGAPLMTTDLPSMREFFHQSEAPIGSLVNSRPDRAVADGLSFLTTLVNNPELLTRLSCAAIDLSRKLSPDTLSRRFVQAVIQH